MEWLRPKWNRLAQFMFLNGARLACRFGKVVITDAEEMHRLYAAKFGIDSAYIAYGANVVESRNPDVVTKYGLSPGRYFLAVGRMIPDNNADLIVSGFSRVKTDFQLALVGGCDYRGNRNERRFLDALKAKADSRVRFLGHVDNADDLRELYCNSCSYIHGHQYGGINPSLLNSLGCGGMVLALNTPFNAEVLNNGEYGILFDKTAESLQEKMQYVCDKPEMAAEFRSRARERIRERFTWDHITDQYEQMLESISLK